MADPEKIIPKPGSDSPCADDSDAAPDGMIMPGDSEPSSTSNNKGKPRGVGRQVAQLVVIPALIVVASIAAASLFVWVASARENLEDQVIRLRGCGGSGPGPWGFQDPRYKDCWRAAFNIASQIDQIQDPQQRAELSEDLVSILNEKVTSDEVLLLRWVLVAIGRLGQPGGLDVLMASMDTASVQVRQGAVEGLLAWSQHNRSGPQHPARRSLAKLVKALGDAEPLVAERAALALGHLATAQDAEVVAALAGALDSATSDRRYVGWNAAVALARLGDRRGAQLVADVLLDRAALSAESVVATDGDDDPMLAQTLEDILLRTLMAARRMTDPLIWDKIKELSQSDSSRRVRILARQLVLERDRSGPDR